MDNASIISLVKENFNTAIVDCRIFRGELTFIIKKDYITDVALFFRDNEQLGCNFLSDLCGVDKVKTEGIFEVIYHLYSISNNHRVRLKVPIPSGYPYISTATNIWETANWHERETFDMFGIVFEGHPNLCKILMPDEFEGHPLRKDYPLDGRQPATVQDIYRKEDV